MHQFATRDFEAVSGHVAGRGVFAFERDGQRYALATDGRGAVVVPSTPDDGLEVRATSANTTAGDLIAPVHGETIDFEKLKKWAGEPAGGEIFFDQEGGGPHDVDFCTPARLHGVLIDSNLLAHLIHNLVASGPVRIDAPGAPHPIRISDGTWFVTLMPMTGDIMTFPKAQEAPPSPRPYPTAFVVGVFDTESGQFIGAGVFSEMSPTLGARRYPVVLAEGCGLDFQEGLDDLRRQFTQNDCMAWMLRLFSDRDFAALRLPRP